MTGYGRAEVSAGSFRASVELRSVNHRYAELKIKLPAELSGVEQTLQKQLQTRVQRGRVDVSVGIARGGDETALLEVNRPLVASYLSAAKQLRGEFGLEGEISIDSILALPDVIKPRAAGEGPTGEEKAVLMAAFDKAVAAHDAMRSQEGRILSRDISARMTALEKLAGRIEKRAPKMVPLFARKLAGRVKELRGGGRGADVFDANDPRIAQEVALMAQKSDITEELVRLKGYVEQVRSLLEDASEPVGKKLDFIMQEMNREANTINSKAVDLAICQDALEMKVEVEKIREQVQNIE